MKHPYRLIVCYDDESPLWKYVSENFNGASHKWKTASHAHYSYFDSFNRALGNLWQILEYHSINRVEISYVAIQDTNTNQVLYGIYHLQGMKS